jgi:hypothetical protein
MKKQMIFTLTLFCLLVSSCGSSTMITSSWRKPAATVDNFKTIFVTAMTSNIAAKQAVENGLQMQLQERGLTVIKGMDVFPPNFTSQNAQQRNLVWNKIQSTRADGILTIALLKKENESRYVRGSGAYGNPGLRYGYYNSFWNYYSRWYPDLYQPGYYENTQVYYLETNLYDGRNEQLLWTAQSKTYEASSIESFLKGYIKTIYAQMQEDGLISTTTTK